MNRVCRLTLTAFCALYVMALALLALGTFGLFGSEKDPLAGVFLIPLGLPWNLWLDGLHDSMRPWFAAAAPLGNVLVIWMLCRFTRSTPPPTG